MARKPGSRSFRIAIKDCGGQISDVARHFSVSRRTIYNWLDHYEMRDEVTKARQSMRTVAQDVIYQRLMSEDDDQAYDAAKFVSLHLRNDGELLMLSPETMRALRQAGLTPGDVVAEFEALIRAQAAVNHE